MSKRFTDTEKWRKGFVRSLEAPYKLLWLYILDECDHAGIWHTELDVASLRIGSDIDPKAALEVFGKRVVAFSDGEKWFIPDFISFQYGELNDSNRVHQSVIRQLKKYSLTKHLRRGLKAPKDKDKDKDKAKIKDKCSEETEKRQNLSELVEGIWKNTPKMGRERSSKKQLTKKLKKIQPLPQLEKVLVALEAAKKTKKWTKDNGQFVEGVHIWVDNEKWNGDYEPVKIEPVDEEYEKAMTEYQFQ